MFCGFVNGYGDSSKYNGLISKLWGVFYFLVNLVIFLGGLVVIFGCCFCIGNYE